MDTMTHRERWLAAIDLEPVDRLPFWPKLNGSYARMQKGSWKGQSVDTFHNYVDSDLHVGGGNVTSEVHKRCTFELVQNGDTAVRRWMVGDHELTQNLRYDADSTSWHPVKFPIETADDIAVMREFYEDITVELDEERIAAAAQAKAKLGNRGVLTAGLGESALMWWVEWLAGVENAHFLLADARDEVEALFETMHQAIVRKTEIEAEHSPADLFYMVENTSTTLISPTQYRQYCAQHIPVYGNILKASGKRLAIHMCGLLKGLLDQLAEVPASVFEAFTSPPVGDTRLLDGRTACPHICIVGGTNAWLWTRSAAEIIAEVKADLDALPHTRGVVLTSAGVMPPLASPETIKAVADFVRAYPVRN